MIPEQAAQEARPPAGSAEAVTACFDAVPAIMWSFEGPDLRVVAANAGARASAGDRPNIIGRPIREVLPSSRASRSSR